MAVDTSKKIVIDDKVIAYSNKENVSIDIAIKECYKEDIKAYEDAGLSGVEAAFKSAGAILKSDYARGVESSIVDKFMQAYYNQTNNTDYLYPVYVQQTLQKRMYADDIISALVAQRMPITGDTAKIPYLTFNDDDEKGKANRKATQYRRIAEGAEFPEVKIALSEETVKIFKYGYLIRTTYEAARRQTFDLARVHIDAIGQRFAYNSKYDIFDRILKGLTATEIDNAKAGEISREELIRAIVSFYLKNGLAPNRLLAGEDMVVALMSMLQDPAFIQQVSNQIRLTFPQFNFSDLKVILYEDMPKATGNKNQFVLWNFENGIMEVEERNSIINENDKKISNQTYIFTASRNSGFEKINKDAFRLYSLKN